MLTIIGALLDALFGVSADLVIGELIGSAAASLATKLTHLPWSPGSVFDPGCDEPHD